MKSSWLRRENELGWKLIDIIEHYHDAIISYSDINKERDKNRMKVAISVSKDVFNGVYSSTEYVVRELVYWRVFIHITQCIFDDLKRMKREI